MTHVPGEDIYVWERMGWGGWERGKEGSGEWGVWIGNDEIGQGKVDRDACDRVGWSR